MSVGFCYGTVNVRDKYGCIRNCYIPALRSFAEQIRHMDSDSTIYVCTYGYEIMNRKGEKSTYADTLWIDTVLPVSKIEELIQESGVAEPSDISLVKNPAENGNGNIWLVTQDGQSSQIVELANCKRIDHMTILYKRHLILASHIAQQVMPFIRFFGKI